MNLLQGKKTRQSKTQNLDGATPSQSAEPSRASEHPSTKRTKPKDISLQDTWLVLTTMAPYLKPYLGRIIGMYLAVLVNVASQLAIPFLVQQSIDQGIVPGSMDRLLTLAGILVGVAVIQYLSLRIQGIQLMRIGNGLLRDLRRDMVGRFGGFSISYFDNHRSGDLITRATNDLMVLEELIMTGFDTLFVDVLMLIGLITVMVVLSPTLSLILLVIVPLLAALVFGLRLRITRTAERVQGNVSQVNSFLNEALSGIRVIRAFSKEKESIERFRGYNDSYYASNKRLYPLTAIFWQSIATLNVVGQTLVILLGGFLFYQGYLTLGVIVAFLGYITRLFQPMQKLSNLINQLGKGLVSARRIFEILKADQSWDEESRQTKVVIGDGAGVVSKDTNSHIDSDHFPDSMAPGLSRPHSSQSLQIRGEVEFSHVNFGYRIDEPVLKDVSFHLEPGTTCALTGHSGSGKTTLVNLVSGFYPALTGSILIDGVAMEHHHLPSLRRSMAAVMQDPQLFSGTIYDNIRLGKPEATKSEIEHICSTLGFHETILNFSRGYETIIGEEGGTISPGQKQLIAFARAMIRNPSILILDEASAYLDMSMERSIQQALLTLMKNRTSFVIAHRLSTIRNADVIFYMEHGQIVEMGSHDELVATGGRYEELYTGSLR